MRESNERKRTRNDVWWIISIMSIISCIVLLIKLPAKAETLKSVKSDINRMAELKEEYTLTISEIQEQTEQLEAEIKTLSEEVEKAKRENPDIYSDLVSAEPKYAYLTFDDGPSQNTIEILDFLKANRIKATFFVIGNEEMDHVYKRIVDEGHTIAIHSETHDYSQIYQNVDTFMQDMNALSDRIEKVTGVRPKIMRFPGGSNNTVSHRYGGEDIMDKIITRVNQEGYKYFDWNVDSMDASATRQSKEVIVESVLKGASGKESAIILMHDAPAKSTTVDALPEIVEGLRKQGFIFKAMTEETPLVQFK